jgi:hypothetical protein
MNRKNDKTNEAQCGRNEGLLRYPVAKDVAKVLLCDIVLIVTRAYISANFWDNCCYVYICGMPEKISLATTQDPSSIRSSLGFFLLIGITVRYKTTLGITEDPLSGFLPPTQTAY